MGRVTACVLERCSRQTQELFDCFLNLDQYEELHGKKGISKEFHEVHYSGIQRDSASILRSGNESSPIFTRSPGYDTRRLRHEIEQKRKSLELEKRNSSSGLERDYASRPSSSERKELREVEQLPAYTPQVGESKNKQEYEDFPSVVRERTYSVGPTEEQLRDAAAAIAKVGDKIEEEYGNQLRTFEEDMKTFLLSTGNLSYELFAAHLNDLIPEDRNWSNFMFMMHLSKRVILTTKSLGTSTTSYFRRFVGTAFAEQVAEREDVVNFVKSQDGRTS